MKLASILVLAWLQGPGNPMDPQEEIKELFRSIEKNLEEIDKMLLEAGTEKSAEGMQKASERIEELLKKALEGQQKVSKDIEQILKKIPPSGSSGSGNPPPPQDPNSQSGQQNQPERERDQTPQEPGQPQPEKPSGQQEPKTPEESNKKPEQYPKNRPMPPKPDPQNPNHQGGQWGDLPPLYQEMFRNQKTDEIPVRYRKQIEDIFRKLSESKP